MLHTSRTSKTGNERIPFCVPESPSFEAVADDLRRVMDSGMLTKGPYLDLLESEVARHIGCREAVAVSNCTTGLTLTLRALGLVGEIILPSFTFCATATAAIWAGLKPVFVDSDPQTFNIDCRAVEAAITPRTTAIVATHIFGNPAPVRELEYIAGKYDLALVFDAAHGFGSERNGRPVGCGGNAEVFSCSPTKLLVAGEGGIITTDDSELARNLRVAREYGNPGNYDCTMVGTNARLSELHAVIALSSLRSLEQTSLVRNMIAREYREALFGVPGLSFQRVPVENRSSYKDFAVVINDAAFGMSRDALAARLLEQGIETRAYYSPAVHAQKAFSRWGGTSNPSPSGELPVATWLSKRVLCLPMYRRMKGMAKYVAEQVRTLQQELETERYPALKEVA